MLVLGTVLNVATIVAGSAVGVLCGNRLADRVREMLINALGLFTLAIGISMTFKSQNPLVPLGGVLIGGLLGEWWHIELQLRRVGAWLEARFGGDTSEEGTARFIKGFVSSSLVFCVGPMAILGSINDGLKHDVHLLAIKSVLDGIASIAFAATMGIGVIFSAVAILIYQGTLTLFAAQLKTLLSEPMIAEMTAAGGLLIMGIGIGPLLELRKIRVANYLPALVIAPAIVAVLHGFGVKGF